MLEVKVTVNKRRLGWFNRAQYVHDGSSNSKTASPTQDEIEVIPALPGLQGYQTKRHELGPLSSQSHGQRSTDVKDYTIN